jgi:hypothetical protein
MDEIFAISMSCRHTSWRDLSPQQLSDQPYIAIMKGAFWERDQMEGPDENGAPSNE